MAKPDRVPALIAALSHPDLSTRLAAVAMLARVGDERAVAPIFQMYHDPARRDPPDSEGDGGGRELEALIRIVRRCGRPAVAALAPQIDHYGAIYILA